VIYADEAKFTFHTRAAAGGCFPEPYLLVIESDDGERLVIRFPALANVARYLAMFDPASVDVVAAPGDDAAEIDALRRVCEGAGVQ